MDVRLMLKAFFVIRSLRRREGLTRAALLAHQSRALRRVREYAYKNSPFYRKFHKGLFERPLEELPVFTKQMMMERFDEITTDPSIRLDGVREYASNPDEAGTYLGRYRVNATSGSTGSPGIFLFDGTEWATVIAAFARAYEWAGFGLSGLWGTRIAIVASTFPLHVSAKAGAAFNGMHVATLRLSAGDPLPSIVEKLNGWRPHILVALPSVARSLAREAAAGRLRVSPRAVFTTSEVLTEDARKDITAAWGENIFNHYAATESGPIAAECASHGGLHVYEDLLIAENVDGENRPVEPGTYGEKLLVTVLFNMTQPLIRYELGDSVRISEAGCACPLPFAVINGIQGRVEDVLYFTDGAGAVVSVHPAAFDPVMDRLAVTGWQIVQEQGGLRVLLCGPPFADEKAVATELADVLRARGVADHRVRIVRVSSIPRDASGKTPLVKALRRK